MKRTIVTSTILVLAAVQLGLATTPATITYQGVLKDDKGDIVADGSYSVTFRLYDAEVGGTNVGSWTETHSVATTDGVFSVELGTQMSLVTGGKFDIPYWLEIEVGGGSPNAPYGADGGALCHGGPSRSRQLERTSLTGPAGHKCGWHSGYHQGDCPDG